MPEWSWTRFQTATLRIFIAAFLSVVGLIGFACTSSAGATIVPTATDDEYSVTHDQTLNVAAPGVLANDVLPPGWEISVVIPPAGGSLSLQADGGFQYTPFTGFVGDDSFVYQMTFIPPALQSVDAAQVGPAGEVPQANVTIHVTNAKPVPADDNYATDQDTTLTVPAAGVLANDADPDGDQIVTVGVVDDVDHGTLDSFNSDGGFVYTPDPGFVGIDTFTYNITDVLPLQKTEAGGVTAQGAPSAATVTITVTGVTTATVEPTAEPTEPGATPIPTEPAPTATSAPSGGVTDLPDTGASPTRGNGSLLGAVIVAMVLAGIGLVLRKTRRRVA
jgi:hypothetical protein